MKNVIFIVFYFSGVVSLYGQVKQVSYSIYYNFRFITNPDEGTYAKPEEYVLYKLDQTSRFRNTHSLYNDSITYAFNQGKGSKLKSNLSSKNLQEYVDLYTQNVQKYVKRHRSDLGVMKNFEDRTAIILLYGTKRKYMVESIDLNWEITTETQTIADMVCTKAKTEYGGRRYEAWFTPEIPVSDGPYIFNGLPGLILKVVDTDKWYEFEIKSIDLKPRQRYVDEDFLADKFLQQIDRETYVAKSQAERDNPKLMPGVINPDPEWIVRLKANRKKRYDLLLEQLAH